MLFINFSLIRILFIVFLSTGCVTIVVPSDDVYREAFENFASELFHIPDNVTLIFAAEKFLNHFENENRVGVPVVQIKDPILLPEEVSDYIELKHVHLRGHSHIKIDYFHMDVVDLTGWIEASVPFVEFSGEYSWPGFYYSSEGRLNVTMVNVSVVANFTMKVNEKQFLEFSELQIEVSKEYLTENFTGLIWEHQALILTGTFEYIFDENLVWTIDYYKPFIMEAANHQLNLLQEKLPDARIRMNRGNYGAKLSRDTSDLLAKICRFMKFDPLRIPDRKMSFVGMKFVVSDILLMGLSRIDKIKSLKIFYRDGKFYVESWMNYPNLVLHYNYGLRTLGLTIFEKTRLHAVDMKFNIMFDPSFKRPPYIAYFHLRPESYAKVSSRSNSFWGKMKSFFSDIESTIRRQTVNALAHVLKLILQGQLNKTDFKEVTNKLLEEGKREF